MKIGSGKIKNINDKDYHGCKIFQLKVKGLLEDLEIMKNTEVKTKMTAGSLNIRKVNHVWMV